MACDKDVIYSVVLLWYRSAFASGKTSPLRLYVEVEVVVDIMQQIGRGGGGGEDIELYCCARNTKHKRKYSCGVTFFRENN